MEDQKYKYNGVKAHQAVTYMCTGCGKSVLLITGGHGRCEYCEHGVHTFMLERPRPTTYICKYCGYTSLLANSGMCSSSPWKYHSYI
jgi:DNA-directed RNA polymerase subunit RPC12/RpoP